MQQESNGRAAVAEAENDKPETTLADLAKLLRGIRETLAANQAELLDADAAAALIGVSRSTWDRMRSSRQIPEPVLLNNGSIIRWRRAVLSKWIADGCPSA